MPIRTRLTFDAQPLENYIAFASSIEDVVQDITREVSSEIRPHLLSDLQFIPGETQLGDFAALSTEGQRRYYWGAVSRGEINASASGHYIRTGGLAAAWDVRLQPFQGGAAFTAQHINPDAKWVYGSFDKSRAYQQPLHRKTGWPNALATVNFWFDAAIELWHQKFQRYLSAVASGHVRRRNR